MKDLPLPDKNARYRFHFNDGSIWKISESEDFADGCVMLYECETGQEGYWTLSKFYEYFEEIDWLPRKIPVRYNHDED